MLDKLIRSCNSYYIVKPDEVRNKSGVYELHHKRGREAVLLGYFNIMVHLVCIYISNKLKGRRA